MDDRLLTLEAVDFAYDKEPVLSGIDLRVGKRQVVALMGPSGCGKTTLLSLILRELHPDTGRIECVAERLSVMFQDPLLLPWRSVLDNVAFALKGQIASRGKREEKASAMLKAVGLSEEHYRQFPHQLSGGMRQRVSLARALVVEPDMLLLDEPFHGLDFNLVQQMQALLRSHVSERGMGLLMVTHDARHAAAMADEILVLSSGPACVMIRFDARFYDAKGKSAVPSHLLLADEIEQAFMGPIKGCSVRRQKA